MILEKIKADRNTAMKEKDKFNTQTIRLILAAINQVEVDNRETVITDDVVISVLSKMVKQRKDSIEAYSKANRQDLLDVELAEMSLITSYLPEQLSESEVIELITKTIKDGSFSSIKDLGKVLGTLKPTLNGKADMGFVSAKARELLSL